MGSFNASELTMLHNYDDQSFTGKYDLCSSICKTLDPFQNFMCAPLFMNGYFKLRIRVCGGISKVHNHGRIRTSYYNNFDHSVPVLPKLLNICARYMEPDSCMYSASWRMRQLNPAHLHLSNGCRSTRFYFKLIQDPDLLWVVGPNMLRYIFTSVYKRAATNLIL